MKMSGQRINVIAYKQTIDAILTLREAPPTKKPSTSGWAANSLQLAPLTDPAIKEERGY